MFESGGVSDSQIINIHHNMIDGAWPRSGNGDGYAGGGILIGDNYTPAASPGFIHSHHNRVINTANYGLSMTGGHDNHMYNNRVVNDGRNQAGVMVSTHYSTGIVLWDAQNLGNMVRVDAKDNAAGHIRTDGRSDFWLPACDPSAACTNNASLATPTNTLEQAERDAWAAELASNGLAVGPPQVQSSPGNAQANISAETTAIYRVWARIMAPDANANSFSLQLDGGSQITMGDSVLAANSWVWVDFSNGNSTSKVNVNLTAGQHSVKLTGRENGVKVDRLIFSGDTACVPTGTGDNCATSTTPPPPVYRPEDINQDGSVNILDFSLMAAKFGQTGSSLGRTDINGDGIVNILDFSLLAAKFGT
jgi:hypothetical protein